VSPFARAEAPVALEMVSSAPPFPPLPRHPAHRRRRRLGMRQSEGEALPPKSHVLVDQKLAGEAAGLTGGARAL
jgi:hypothetical protein